MDALTPATVMAEFAEANRTAWYDLSAEAGPRRAALRIYGRVGGGIFGGGVSASRLASQLADLDVDEIEVQINSPGGSVFEGIAIFNALRAHKAKIITRVDGLAASIASVIAQAGDERNLMSGSQMMIHNAWGGIMGDADELRKFADVLEQQNDVIAGIYAERSGRKTEGFLAAMKAETWLTADKAIEMGLADAVVTTSAPPNTTPDDDDSEDESSESEDADASTGDIETETRFDPSLSMALLSTL